jgi:hypothetical protein
VFQGNRFVVQKQGDSVENRIQKVSSNAHESAVDRPIDVLA